MKYVYEYNPLTLSVIRRKILEKKSNGAREWLHVSGHTGWSVSERFFDSLENAQAAKQKHIAQQLKTIKKERRRLNKLEGYLLKAKLRENES